MVCNDLVNLDKSGIVSALFLPMGFDPQLTTKSACEQVLSIGGLSRTVDEWKCRHEQSHQRAKKPMVSKVEGLAQVSKQSQLVKMISRATPLTSLLRFTHWPMSHDFAHWLCFYWNAWEPACRLQLHVNTTQQHMPYCMSREGGRAPKAYEKVMNSCCLAYGYKSRILFSLRMFMTEKKHHF